MEAEEVETITPISDEVSEELWQRRIDRAQILLNSDDPQSLIDEAGKDPNFTN